MHILVLREEIGLLLLDSGAFKETFKNSSQITENISKLNFQKDKMLL